MIYLDHAATAFPRSRPVIAAVEQALVHGGSPGRSGHRLARWSDQQVWHAREGLARLVGASAPENVTFALNATSALNTVINHLARRGGVVLTSAFEHNSVTRPLYAAKALGLRNEVIPPSPTESVDLEWVEARIRQGDVTGVLVTWASNVSGNVLPVAQLSSICRDRGVFFAADAAQAVGHIPVEAGLVDVLAFAGHKGLGGPQGVGGLVIGPDIVLDPLVRGGSGGRSESPNQPRWLPWSQEAGTLNGPGIAGLAAALAEKTPASVSAAAVALQQQRERLESGLQLIEGVVVVRHATRFPPVGVTSFVLAHVAPTKVAELLEEEYDIMVRAGLHCAPLAHRTLGTLPMGTVRMSIDSSTSDDDIVTAVAAVSQIANELRDAHDRGEQR